MCLSLLSIDYGVKPNFQRAALGTIAGGPRCNKKRQLYPGPLFFKPFYMTDFYIFSHHN